MDIVAAKLIAAKRAGVLHRGSHRHDELESKSRLDMLGHDFRDSLVHLHLIVVVISEAFVAAVNRVRPGHIETESDVGKTRPDYAQKFIQVRLIRRIVRRFAGGLLKYDKIPVLVIKRVRKRTFVAENPAVFVSLAIDIRGRVFLVVFDVSFQSAAAQKDVCYHEIFYAQIFSDIRHVANGIVAVAVADKQNFFARKRGAFGFFLQVHGFSYLLRIFLTVNERGGDQNHRKQR